MFDGYYYIYNYYYIYTIYMLLNILYIFLYKNEQVRNVSSRRMCVVRELNRACTIEL